MSFGLIEMVSTVETAKMLYDFYVHKKGNTIYYDYR